MTHKILIGNCKETIKTLDDNSIDSIVTDPPYEFMNPGKSWDKSGIAYDVDLWKECLRVLKPGGHLIAFSGSRTYHRMAVAIEDAGFDIRDQIMWIYGCLSPDTYIVTPYGNKSYKSLNKGDLALCYDANKNEYSYQGIEEIYEYDIKDTAYRIQSDYTDQIVSRNHRCLVERDGREIFEFAEKLSSQENIPFLENLSDLQYALQMPNQRTSQSEQNMFRRLQTSLNREIEFWYTTTRKTYWKITTYLSRMWNNFLEKFQMDSESFKTSLQSQMQWNDSFKGIDKTFTQGKTKLETRIRNQFSKKNDRGFKSFLEGWNNLQKSSWESQRSDIYSVSDRVYGYGTQRWLYNGTSSFSSTKNQSITVSNRSSTSYQSQSIGQSNRKSNAIQEQFRSQAIRGWQGHKASMATITPFEYEGKVWCVKVPTGSFVAIRNGKAFTTGNSGFPKSMDIAKAIDKAEGTEFKKLPATGVGFMNEGDDGYNVTKNQMIRVGEMSDKAKQWDGWGTALKPAHEPMVLARKPLEGTLANNVLEYETGGLNIDASRVPIDPEADASQLRTMKRNKREGIDNQAGWGMTTKEGDEPQVVNPNGRFPANIIHDGSEEVLEHFPDSMGGTSARFFYCAKPSRKEKGEFNNHPTVKPIELMRHLVKLVTPENGLVLDPFLGSGTTGCAAVKDNFNFIGCELSPEFAGIAERRISEYVDELADVISFK